MDIKSYGQFGTNEDHESLDFRTAAYIGLINKTACLTIVFFNVFLCLAIIGIVAIFASGR